MYSVAIRYSVAIQHSVAENSFTVQMYFKLLHFTTVSALKVEIITALAKIKTELFLKCPTYFILARLHILL